MTESQTQAKLSILESIKVLMTASRGYLMVNLANFGDGIAYFGILHLMVPFMIHNVHFETGQATVAISVFTGMVTLFTALGGGFVSDRLGVRRALTLCIAMLVVGRIMYVLAPQMGTLGAANVAWLSILIMGAAEGIIQPALYSGVKEYTDDRTKTLGYAFLYAVMNLGIVVGEFLSPFVRDFWATHFEHLDVKEVPRAGIAGSFWFFILITVAMLLANYFFFTKKVEEKDRKIIKQAYTPEEGNWFQRLRNLPLWDARFLFFIFILLPVRTLFAHQWLTIPEYVIRVFPPEVGARVEWIAGLNPIVIVIFVPLIAALTLKARVIDMMIIGTVISAASSFLLCTEPSVTLLLAYIILFSLGEAFWSSRFLEYIADIAPAERVGVYMGIATVPWFLAKTITGFYAGSMLDLFVPAAGTQDTHTLWFIYGATAMISPVGLILARKWLLKGVHNHGVGDSAQA